MEPEVVGGGGGLETRQGKAGAVVVHLARHGTDGAASSVQVQFSSTELSAVGEKRTNNNHPFFFLSILLAWPQWGTGQDSPASKGTVLVQRVGPTVPQFLSRHKQFPNHISKFCQPQETAK